MFRLGASQKVSGKLDEMLQKADLTVQQLFSVDNIIGDIKNKIETFVEYCKTHRKFTIRIIKLALDTSIEELQEKGLKDVAFIATEFLTCDEDSLAQLFFEEEKEKDQFEDTEIYMRNSSQICQKIQEQLQDNQNVSEGKQQVVETNNNQTKVSQRGNQRSQISNERDLKSETKAQIQEKECAVFQKYELIKLSLNILLDASKNETCLGYINKLFSFLIRKQSDLPLEFFSTHPQYTELLIKNLKYDSIANLLSQMVACEDKNRVYKYQLYKQQLFQSVIRCLIDEIDNEGIFQGIMIFVQEVLNNTKQSYYEYFQDFKRCADILVSQKVLRSIYELILKKEEKCFKNSVTYLHMIAKRINSQNEEMDYYERDNEKKQPTMNFETNFLYEDINRIVQLIGQIDGQNGIAKNLYLSLVVELMKHQKFSQFQFNFIDNFVLQLQYLKNIRHGGIIKNTLFQIIDLSISRANPEDILSLAVDYIEVVKKYFQHINQNEQNNNSNKNQNLCYDRKILLLLKKRNEDTLGKRLQELGIKLDKIQQRYGTSLGAQNPHKLSASGTGSDFNLAISNSGENGEQDNNKQDQMVLDPLRSNIPTDPQHKGFSVGKNNIIIPSLNLPHNPQSHPNKSPRNNSNTLPDIINNGQDDTLNYLNRRPTDIIVDIDTEGVIIEHEEVERLVINSPKRVNYIGFMGASSPRVLDFSGSGGFRSDRSNNSEGSNSARSKGEDYARKGSSQIFTSPRQNQTIEHDSIKDPIKDLEQQKNKVISKEEVLYFIRHAILI